MAKREGSTVFLDKDFSDRLDEYVKAHGLTRKSFVEKALTYFENTGLDLEVWAYENDHTETLSKIADRLERATAITEEERSWRQSVKQLMIDFTQRQKALPSLEAKDQELKEFKERVDRLIEDIKSVKGWRSKSQITKIIEEFSAEMGKD